jgi:hypothetical protein
MENETSSDKLFRLAQLDEQIKTLAPMREAPHRNTVRCRDESHP